MHLVGVHQELRAVIVDRQREVIGDGFVQVEAGCPAEACGEIDPLLPVLHIVIGRRFGHVP